ncbi:MAG TPA: hypothetical protein PKD90_04365, partial [Phnomibacter sp.]|nr:hypothetical protein [Phnomibacter sp.]
MKQRFTTPVRKLSGMLAIMLAAWGLPNLTYAQSAADQKAAKMVIENLFSAMIRADSAALRACFAPGAIMQTIAMDSAGQTSVRTDGVDRFVKSVGAQAPGALDEQIKFGEVLIDGPLATVWTPYSFYVKGTF